VHFITETFARNVKGLGYLITLSLFMITDVYIIVASIEYEILELKSFASDLEEHLGPSTTPIFD